MRRLAAVLLALTSFLLIFAANTAPSQASSVSRAQAAFFWAETQRGKPYQWGGTGPYGYDCSGLVVAAFRREGISLPRTTFSMLSSPKLHYVPASQARPGDLAFFGSGHVEFFANGHTTFGAASAGTRLSWHHDWPSWHPSAYYRVG